MGQTRYPSKSWAFKSCFYFKFRQHGQQQLYLQYKLCWILYKIVGAPLFSQPLLFIQPPLHHITISTKNPLPFFSKFHLPLPPLFKKSSLRFTLRFPVFIPQKFCIYSFLCTTIPTVFTKTFFLNTAIYPVQAALSG